MKKIVVAMVLLVAAGYGLLSYHFILFDDTLKVIKKTGVRYENTFVDARGAKKMELILKPDLMAAGVKDVIGQVEKSIK